MNLNKMREAAKNLEYALQNMQTLIKLEQFRQEHDRNATFKAEPELWAYYAERIKKLMPEDLPNWPESNAHDLGVFTVVPPTLERFENSY